MAMVLAYWDIRGLAQPIRLLLEYTGTEYDEKFYTCGEAPDYDRSSWLGEKDKLGIDFPNLPYLLDGDRKITQSNAIMRYIARKHNLCGETEAEKVRVDLLENQAMDFRNGFVRLCYTDFENQKSGYISSLQGTLKQFSDFLGDRKWFAGDKALEKIAAYMKSSRFIKTPVNNKMAKWGHKKE
uniref:glutathione transferase n=1 Tax=Xiphophorus couchianus TaxID=32473 RepID=A0A3B5L5S5_9TELE